MFCSKCGKENLDGDVFCGECGARLLPASTQYDRADEALPPPVMDSRAEFIMQRPPEDEMRPLTRVAYAIHDSEQHSTLSALVSVVFVAFCVGIVANLLAIFEKMNSLAQTLNTSGETYLSEIISDQVSGDHITSLVLLTLLLALLTFLFVVSGKLKLRLKKINRKERKFKSKGIFLDVNSH